MRQVVLTLALGIGASAMMFSLVDAALLRPLPFQRPFVDPRTLAFTSTISALVGIVVAVMPAFRASRGNLADVIFRARPLEESVRRQTSTARFVATLLTMFSGAALLLAAIGLYGLIAYVVGLSRREIAIRLALGADRRGVAWLIVRNGMILVAAGAAGAFAAARAIQDQLFQTAGADPEIYLPVAALLVVVALLASLTPTRRALRENPHEALRAE